MKKNKDKTFNEKIFIAFAIAFIMGIFSTGLTFIFVNGSMVASLAIPVSCFFSVFLGICIYNIVAEGKE